MLTKNSKNAKNDTDTMLIIALFANNRVWKYSLSHVL